tara:strand:+ start:2623 stop:2832 length:210 start_codon:yes stop_codon:yes gene_type:complete
MKTAMQELWEYVKNDKENIDFKTYGILRNKILPLIEKEKGQIISAFVIKGFENILMEEAENYYNETFNN